MQQYSCIKFLKMKEIIPFDDDFALKYFQDTMQRYDANWVESVISWITDSKFRTKKRLDQFIGFQLNNPTKQVFNESLKFQRYKYYTAIIEILKWVAKFRYESDPDGQGKAEDWKTALRTLIDRAGDCEDLNSLIYILARLCGVPWWLIWNAIGDVYNPNMLGNKEGHYWLMFFDPRVGEEGKWYTIDATYKFDPTPIKDRAGYEPNPKRYIRINYLWNEKGMYKNLEV